ncbi:docking protein 4-like isoform X2 [Rhinoderma darwinii]|uniref:docking protein 4-like isoform X2 n=1 Tax=Rhinoderma darwinii TaxID=43563 RepID=UPI003F66CFAA
MASNSTDIVRQGYVRMKSRKLGVMEISNVKCITRLPKETKRQAVAVTFCDDLARTFTCDSELEAEEWFKVLSMDCPGPQHQDCSLGEPDLLTPGVQSEQTERFSVFLLPSSHLDVYGECKMQITQENLYLWDPHNKRLTWPLCALRRYGSDSSRFTFEAERVCGISEGLYTFQTLQGQQIYERVHAAVLALAEQHKSLLRDMEKTSRRLNKEAENVPHPGPSASMLPRSAYWHHINSSTESSSNKRLGGRDSDPIRRRTFARKLPTSASQ